MAVYVKVEGMAASAESILSAISSMEGHISEYDTSAEASLGRSTFRPEVESNLEGIKSSYQAMIPELTKIKDKITEIQEEYNLRGQKIQKSGAKGSPKGPVKRVVS